MRLFQKLPGWILNITPLKDFWVPYHTAWIRIWMTKRQALQWFHTQKSLKQLSTGDHHSSWFQNLWSSLFRDYKKLIYISCFSIFFSIWILWCPCYKSQYDIRHTYLPATDLLFKSMISIVICFSYTANVCRDLQGLCGKIGVRGFQIYRDCMYTRNTCNFWSKSKKNFGLFI